MLTVVRWHEDQRINPKRVRPLYPIQGLTVGRRTRKRVAGTLVVLQPAAPPGEHWAMHVLRGTLSDGDAFGTPENLDTCTSERLAPISDTRLPGARVGAVLHRLLVAQGRPVEVLVDDRSEF